MYVFAGAKDRQLVRLTFKPEQYGVPNCVLIFAFYEGRLLLVKHRERGWELPGGKIEPGELAEAAAKREAQEEAGATIAVLEPVGQYSIDEDGRTSIVKTIYIALIASLSPLPGGHETDEVRLVSEPPSPSEVRSDPSYSYVMKDDVYELTLARIADHRYGRQRW
ncbi:MAG: NUDIX domain-containing protein [Paenibacillaceae bacterium]|nr:NUDIX domain-containing protein [Paenibacillaceae bacterium]